VQSPDIGEFIKGLRENARISLRQLADQAGVSNPYLSQIERGLRKPSAEVLAQIAGALRVSTPVMYLRAGLLGSEDGPGVLSSIAADPHLSMAQKQSLTQIYETFVRENARHQAAEADGQDEAAPLAKKSTVTKKTTATKKTGAAEQTATAEKTTAVKAGAKQARPKKSAARDSRSEASEAAALPETAALPTDSMKTANIQRSTS
jgi:transcriptional regulator with XRE-family HTH domain